MILLDNIVSDTTSESYESKGGPALFILRGDDFTDVTVTLNLFSKSDPDSRSESLEAFTAQANRKLDYLPVGTYIQVTTTGVGTGDNIFAEILQ